MIWEKYLQIGERVNILKNVPFIHAYNYENHDNANRKMGKRIRQQRKKNTHFYMFI